MTPALLNPGSAHFHPRPFTVPNPERFCCPLRSSAAASLSSKGIRPSNPLESRLTGSGTAVGSAAPGERQCGLHLRLRSGYALATVTTAAGPFTEAGQRRPRLPHWLRAREGRGRGGNLGRVESPANRDAPWAAGGEEATESSWGGRAEVSLGARRGRLLSMLSPGTPGRGLGRGGEE